jgi:hypothetical protein
VHFLRIRISDYTFEIGLIRKLADRPEGIDLSKRRVDEVFDLPRAQAMQTIDYLPVASALDYDTAFQAGRLFGPSGVSGVAMGLGAFMADDSLSDTVVLRGRAHRLRRRLPMRYLRTALVARGFWDGGPTR